MGFKYQVAGLNLISDIEIPTLILKEFNKADIQVLIGPKVQPPDKSIEYLPDDKILYKDAYNNVFSICGSRILISLQDKSINQAAISLLGIPLGYALQYNNFQVLHGSAVALHDSSICFVGKSKAGKSSISLALINNGFGLVTEDLCLVKNLEIYNFSNWIKTKNELMPSELIQLSKISIKNDSRKRSLFQIDSKHISKNRTKIRAIYFLDEGVETKIANLKPLDAFRHLFTYAYRKNNHDKENLRNLTSLCESANCFLFSRNIEKSLEENKIFLIDHLIKQFPEFERYIKN